MLRLLIITLTAAQVVRGENDRYSAVVVEYSPSLNPSVDAGTNILNNVKKYVEFINAANSQMLVDIIVFPEDGLKGYYNQQYFLEVPDPKDNVRPCVMNTTYEAPLVQLSCAARATATYVVVNLSEKFYNESMQRTLYFNTDVVFDLYGTILARYRKIHLFGEKGKQAPPEKEFVYFDTEFGVRFGLFTCFDIIFEDPGLYLAKLHNVSHFIFPTAWFSELPFLTAIQEQWYWSYTMDAVVLAAGYNDPKYGSCGSGIYLGKKGPLIYAMTEAKGSFMLQGNIPKQFRSKDNSVVDNTNAAIITAGLDAVEENMSDTENESSLPGNYSKIKMKQDFLEVYVTELLTLPEDIDKSVEGSEITIPFSAKRVICQSSFCCEFSFNVTSVFSKTKQIVTRGDDYSQLYYRLAVFDGVRNYDHFATGGLQTCAIIPCVSKDLPSCGLRSDDHLAQPNKFLDLFQKEFIFESINITGIFSNNNSFVGPNVLIKGDGWNFGTLLPSDSFMFSQSNVTDTKVQMVFQTVKPIKNLVTVSLYGRLFNRDGQPYSGRVSKDNSSGLDMCINMLLLISAIIMIKHSL